MVTSETEKASARSRTRALPSSCNQASIFMRRGSASSELPVTTRRPPLEYAALPADGASVFWVLL